MYEFKIGSIGVMFGERVQVKEFVGRPKKSPCDLCMRYKHVAKGGCDCENIACLAGERSDGKDVYFETI